MSTTNIEWADRVWNPVTGCTKVSPGCKHCYAEGVAHRFWATQYPAVEIETGGPAGTMSRARKFTDVMTHPDRLLEPLSWRKPARVFVNSMSDLFHEDVPDDFIDAVWGTMAKCPQHTFQILTKRADRMKAYFDKVVADGRALFGEGRYVPRSNVWLGVSVEDQQRADERIPLLLQTPAAVRFISAEPLLGPVLLDNGCNSWLTCTSPVTVDDYEAMPPLSKSRRTTAARALPDTASTSVASTGSSSAVRAAQARGAAISRGCAASCSSARRPTCLCS